MSKVIRVSEETSERTIIIIIIIIIISISRSRRELLRGLMDDVIELCVPIDVQSYQGLGGNL